MRQLDLLVNELVCPWVIVADGQAMSPSTLSFSIKLRKEETQQQKSQWNPPPAPYLPTFVSQIMGNFKPHLEMPPGANMHPFKRNLVYIPPLCVLVCRTVQLK